MESTIPLGKYYENRGKRKLILISKEIAHKLHNEHGVRFGENGISTSKTKYKKYYLCESPRNLGLLKRLTNTK